MRKVMLVIGMAAIVGCAGKQQPATQAQQKQADEAAKIAALEEQNAALKAQTGDLEKRLAETTAAKSELELTAAKLTEQSGEYAKLNQELQGNLTVKLNDRLLFAEGSSKLSPESKRTLDTIADAILQVKDKSVIVAGFTDDSEAGGKDAKVRRWQLSTTRAVEVAKYLVGRGVDATVIGIAGFGEGRPVVSNDSRGSRAQNRRVEIALTPIDHKLGTIEVKPATLK